MVELFQASVQLPLLGLTCLQCSPSEGASVLLALIADADLTTSVMTSLINSVASLGESAVRGVRILLYDHNYMSM
jgi:hypothetical protein